MRLYHRGDQGRPVADIQRRLDRVGFSTDPDAPATFGAATERAVREFQGSRGLAVDGIVGPDTWRLLCEATMRLGDRVLYHRVPMMRGDDVAELQRRLNSLGFDAGKVDGIFGPETLAALLDFQHNRGMAEDGLAGPEVVSELELMAHATQKQGREVVRERQWLVDMPPTLVGRRVYLDAFCRTEAEAKATWGAALTLNHLLQGLGARPTLSRSEDTRPTERVRAQRANRLGVDFVVSFASPRADGPGIWYFSSPYSQSTAGAALAHAIADRTGLAPRGKAIPILKETRSPAVVVVADPLDDALAGRVAQALIDLHAADLDTRLAHAVVATA